MELVMEPDLYSPSIDDTGNYVDKIPSFHIIKKDYYVIVVQEKIN